MRNLLYFAVAVAGAGLLALAAHLPQQKLAPPPKKEVVYEVQPGDTLWDIAAAYRPQEDPRAVIDEIAKINGISPLIRPGQKLRIPARGEPRSLVVEATAYTAGPESTGKKPGDPDYETVARRPAPFRGREEVTDQLNKIPLDQSKKENKTDAIGRVTWALKEMARDLKVPVIVLVQLNSKDISRRASPRPTAGDIKDSSCPEEDGDVILFLWRPAMYARSESERRKWAGKAEIIVSRQRSGPTGSVWLQWVPEYTRFLNLSEEAWPSEGELDKWK